MDFTQKMDNGYMIPSSVAVGSGEATDIRCVCDTVEDFKTFLDATGMELRYEGLVTYEKVNKLLKVYKGNDTWQTVGEGGNNVDTSSFITLTQLSQQLSNYYTKAQTDEKITVLSGKIEELEGNSTNNGDSIVVKDIFANNELPRIYMASDRLGLLASKSDPEAMCECEIKINNKTIKCYATGKVQGTTSAGFPAKNFTFKFYSDKECSIKQKINVGWGEQYKYCFKKNWVDTTHTRNLAGARIAYDMVESRPESDFKTNLQTAPRNGAVDGFPCKLYINGEFWGLYTWNIPKDEWMFNMDSDNPNHMVLCGEANNNGNMDVIYSTQFRKLWDGGDGSEWSIEVGTLTDNLKNSFNNAINFVMTSSDEDFRANISNYFDLYSLLDYYIFAYLTCHYDGLGKNMLIGTYDGVHWGAMLYDMDSIFGATYNGASFMEADKPCPAGYQENNSLLWQRLEKCFMDELRNRYFELRKGALSLGNIITHVEEIYDLVPDRVFSDDRAKWSGLPSQATNTITRFRNYMRDRAVYVDRAINELVTPVECTDIKLSSDSLVFEDSNGKTLNYTLTPSNTTEKVVWNVVPSGIVNIADGMIIPASNGECLITVTCGNNVDTCNVIVSGFSDNAEVKEDYLFDASWGKGKIDGNGNYSSESSDTLSDFILMPKGVYTFKGSYQNWKGVHVYNLNKEYIYTIVAEGTTSDRIFALISNSYIRVQFNGSYDNTMTLKHNVSNVEKYTYKIESGLLSSFSTLPGKYSGVELTLNPSSIAIPVKSGYDVTSLAFSDGNIKVAKVAVYGSKVYAVLALDPSEYGESLSSIQNYFAENDVSVIVN